MTNAVKDNNYFTICGFMTAKNRLALSGVNLITYAIIYSFTQDGTNTCEASIDYIAEFAGCSDKSIKRSLASLSAVGFIIKDDRNETTGKTNSYRANLEILDFSKPVWNFDRVGQNVQPGEDKMSLPVGQNVQPGEDKMSLPVGQNVPQYYNIYSNDIIDDNKVSKKGSRKVGRIETKGYDSIKALYDLTEEEEKAVSEFISHCFLNKHRLTNDTFKRFLDNLSTYAPGERVRKVHSVIDSGEFMLKPCHELHYDVMGLASDMRGKSYEDIIEAEIFRFPTMVKKKLWEFIDHCRANKRTLTNERLFALCSDLNSQFPPSDIQGKLKALETAIKRGYMDIKHDESWISKAVKIQKDELPETLNT